LKLITKTLFHCDNIHIPLSPPPLVIAEWGTYKDTKPYTLNITPHTYPPSTYPCNWLYINYQLWCTDYYLFI